MYDSKLRITVRVSGQVWVFLMVESGVDFFRGSAQDPINIDPDSNTNEKILIYIFRLDEKDILMAMDLSDGVPEPVFFQE